jgi:hypothetical protein
MTGSDDPRCGDDGEGPRSQLPVKLLSEVDLDFSAENSFFKNKYYF